ncbi:shTK domain protein [Ancylostoma caninum]|uniref:ShTK domain protein n=1 Tax=Ancylostoma caninum TaxID=29170 RepID=A0A368FL98_ANCCA|nr:shTK domain protein [Ancylostoma caninum]
MFFYVLCILVLINGANSAEVTDTQLPCEDVDDIAICSRIKDYYQCTKPQYKPLAEKRCRKTCGFC